MRAMVLHDINDFRLETVEKPALKKDEVLVAVKAAGICGSDIPRVYKTGTYAYPLIPGHEFSGLVAEIGEGVDAGWMGQRVGVFPLIPCKNCLPCQKKQYEMCRNYSYLGSRRDGGFAEYVAVPTANLIVLPDHVSFEAAAMLEPMAVAVHAMRRLQVTAADTAAVCGLGTIGLLLAMFLREAGVKKILVIGNKESQKHIMSDMGISEDSYCDSRNCAVEEWIAERTGGVGVDVFFECVGKEETIMQAMDNTTPGGRICLVGNPAADICIKKSVYWKILRNQLQVTGTWNSSFTGEMEDDWHYVLERLSQNKISPGRIISHRFSLEEIEQGFCIMRDKKEDYGKIMSIIK
ncbi:MAG: galactitol-1-phosphate 5-dehydrogenase [Lachnospiraceae bacterium]|nr:galactitol-1-phosphate 5-dehydrogenase [Lachnospiraceae bacterium]